MRLVAAFLFYLTGLIWLWQAVGEGSVFKLALGVIWLAGGVIHTVRHIRAKKPPKEE